MTIADHHAYLATLIGVCEHASSEFLLLCQLFTAAKSRFRRYVIGAVGLVIWALAIPSTRNILAPIKDGELYFIMRSSIGVSVTYLAFHWAFGFASVTQVATVLSTIPIFVGLSNLIINGARLSTVKIITGLLVTLGVVVMLTDGCFGQLAGDTNTLFGIVLAGVCAAFGSACSVLVKPIITKHDTLPTTAISLAIGAVGLWIALGAFWSIWVDLTTLTQILWFGGLPAAPDITRAPYPFS